MGGDGDTVVLAGWEQEALAQLAARVGDPWLAAQLRGRGKREVTAPTRAVGMSAPAVVANGLLVVWGIVTLATLSPWLAVAAAAPIVGVIARGAWRRPAPPPRPSG